MDIQRIQKVLEDAGIKLESVVTDVMGNAARRMIEALIAGECDPVVLADMALTRMRPRIPDLRRALLGCFDEHYGLLTSMNLAHVDHLSAGIDRLDAEVGRVIAPFGDQLSRLMTIPGVGKRIAEVVIAEIGVNMGQFPTAAHLASWAGLCPGNHESAGKSKSGRAAKANTALRVALCEAAWAGVRKNDSYLGAYLGAQFRRFQRRFGKRAEGKAIFACAHTLVVMIWHVLAEPDAIYEDLGADWFTRRRQRRPRPAARASTRTPRPPRHPHPSRLTLTQKDRATTFGAHAPTLPRAHPSDTNHISCQNG